MILACNRKVEQFVVEGTISGTKGQTLYLEEVGTGNVLSLDSCHLNEVGAFRFAYEGTSYPMFYRLRLGERSIHFAADSATHIVLSADVSPTYGLTYKLSEAEPYNHQIREVALYRQRVDRSIDSLVALYQGQSISQAEAGQGVDSLVQNFKRHLCTHYIYVDPKSPVAFFALFQQKNGGTYFSPEDEGDERAFAAVATAYDTFYAQAPYTPFLRDMALQAIAQRKKRQALEQNLLTDDAGLKTINFPEIKLRDDKGQWQSLSELAEGRSVLVSFTDYRAEYSPQYVAELRDLQSKRPELFIYEVGVDEDHYHWRNATQSLPWLCVRDGQGQAVRAYNVQALPTTFLIEGGKLRRLKNISEALR